MVILSTAARRRRQKFQAFAATVGKLVLVIVLLVAVAYAAFEAGTAKNIENVKRMRASLADAEEQKLELIAAKETAQERVRRMAGTLAELEKNYRENVPEGQVAELLSLTRQRLADGVDAERLRFLLENAAVERSCDKVSETEKLLIRTPLSTVLDNNTVGFADNQIVINADGKALQGDGEFVPSTFDPLQPIYVRFLSIGGDIEKVEGRLPLNHAVVLDKNEYQFQFINEGDGGQITISMRRCDYP